MTILLGFNDYGILNQFDVIVIDCIKSFLLSTPNEKMIKIHNQMKQYNYRPYKKISFPNVFYRQYTSFSMELIGSNNNSITKLTNRNKQSIELYSNDYRVYSKKKNHRKQKKNMKMSKYLNKY
jgi:hypothetical protein